MTKIKFASALCLALITSVVQAQQNNDVGFYGIGQFGITTGDSKITSSTYSGTGTSQSNNWALGLGYDINKDFAVEALYGDFYRKKGEQSINYSGGTSTDGNTTNGMGFLVNALAKHKFSDNTTLFAGPSAVLMKIKSSSSYGYTGAGFSGGASASETKNVSVLGIVVGATFDLDKRTALRVNYAQYQEFTWDHPVNAYNYQAYSEKTKISNLGLGLIVKF